MPACTSFATAVAVTIGAGLVDAGKRDAILATLPETRRMDAATALAWVGAVLMGFGGMLAGGCAVGAGLSGIAARLYTRLGFREVPALVAAWERLDMLLNDERLTMSAFMAAATGEERNALWPLERAEVEVVPQVPVGEVLAALRLEHVAVVQHRRVEHLSERIGGTRFDVGVERVQADARRP